MQTIIQRGPKGEWKCLSVFKRDSCWMMRWIGKCCGYVRCKEKNTGFNCMTEADCQGYTNQGYVTSKPSSSTHTYPPTLPLPSHGDKSHDWTWETKNNHSGVCPDGSKCCIHLRGAIPSPELVADNSFSSFSADTVAESAFIDNPAPGVLNAFNIPSEDDRQDQNLDYLGRTGTQQAGGLNQQAEAFAAIANEGLWDDVLLE